MHEALYGSGAGGAQANNSSKNYKKNIQYDNELTSLHAVFDEDN